MKNATSFWGNAGTGTTGGECGNNYTDAGTGTQTCNGNGDGFIATISVSDNWEYFRHWQHLKNAGLLEGGYNGVHGAAGTSDHVFGVNVPASKLGNSGWGGAHSPNYAGSADAYAMDYQHFYGIGSYATNSLPDGAIMTPQEAWSIDKKIDDGKPAYGKVIARFWNNACSAADNGTHANNNLEASYKLSDTSIQCTFYFRNAF